MSSFKTPFLCVKAFMTRVRYHRLWRRKCHNACISQLKPENDAHIIHYQGDNIHVQSYSNKKLQNIVANSHCSLNIVHANCCLENILMKVNPKIMFVQNHHVLCRVLCTKRLSCFILFNAVCSLRTKTTIIV